MNNYFDNAATSFPKPPAVAEAMGKYLCDVGGPYGRSSHGHAFEVSRTIERTRDAVADAIGTSLSDYVAFLPNATTALNVVLFGVVRGDATIFVSPLEHNAVMRPLETLQRSRNACWKLLPSHADGLIDLTKFEQVADEKPAAVVINHQSNVSGLVQPLAEIRRRLPGVMLIVDASQSLGNVPLEADAWELDAVAWTGHKGLLGPPGVGGLFLREPADVSPLVYGGTGSRSAEFTMPETMPDRFEAGTPNIVGIFGLAAALENTPNPSHCDKDWLTFIRDLREIPDLKVWGAAESENQGRVVSVTHMQRSVSELGDRLWKDHQIAVRVGLHCSPLAHRSLGTFPDGTVRFAASPYHSSSDFDRVVLAMKDICQQ